MLDLLPNGGALPEDLRESRHTMVLWVLWLHVAAIPVYALVVGYSLGHGLIDATPVGLLAASASLRHASGPRTRAVLASLGLLTASAVLVHLAGGATEMHFHFFVMIALIALYQDWVPFGTAIAFVVAHHAGLGYFHPHDVYDHSEAAARPLLWAFVHAIFVLAASAAQITNWRVTEMQHERAEEALRESEHRFRALIEHSSDGVRVVSAEGKVTYNSPSIEREFGAEFMTPGSDSLDAVHPDDQPKLQAMIAGMKPDDSEMVEVRLQNGKWIEARVTNLCEVPGIEGFVANFREVTERKELEQRLAHQAFHDSLTGLPNRALFADRIEHALLARRRDENQLVAVLFIDLDDFKTVNDALGHVTGDEVLVETSRRIAGCLRASDTCARLGGDEFGVLLEGVRDPGNAYDLATRLIEALSAEISTSQGSVAVNASIGLAFSQEDDRADDVIRDADLALYQAKGRGKGRLEIFEDGMRSAVLERLALKVEIHRALAAGEFVNHYQPVVSLSTGQVVGAEALVRWAHPTRGLLPPGAFIDIAEESGLIVGIGRDVLRRACADAMTWPDGPDGPLDIAVNLSVRQLQHDEVLHEVIDALRSTGLAPERLTLEITESVLVADPQAAAEALAALKRLGVRIAIDDFGTGYSSLSYLHRFPVDCLKIDKSFVDQLGGAGSEPALVQAIIGLADTLGLSVVAEGIEEPEQWTSLGALGCGLGQGYLFAKPMALPEFVAFARPSMAEPV